jgi:3-methyl-2-oxobutanoate hydroxymethyltransferase
MPEIPVMGHLGLTPQSKNIMGGYKVQGKTLELAKELLEDAILLDSLGCFSFVLEGVPKVVAQTITEKVSIPTYWNWCRSSCRRTSPCLP